MLLKEQIKRNIADMKTAQSLKQEGFDVWVSDIYIYIEIDSPRDIDRTRFIDLKQNSFNSLLFEAYDTKLGKKVIFSAKRKEEQDEDTI